MSLDRPEPGRPWFKRLTVVGAALFAAIEAAEQTGMVPPGTREGATTVVSQFANLVQVFGGFLGTLGVYRHIAND